MTEHKMSIMFSVSLFIFSQPFSYLAWRMSGYENKTLIIMELSSLLLSYVFYALDEIEVRV